MASVSGIYRVIVIPFGDADHSESNEAFIISKIPALVGSTANVLVSAVGFDYQLFEAYSGGTFHFGRGVKIEIWETTAGDATIVTNLPAFQTAVGTTIYTWSISMTWGF